ncbi:MAG: hypothetical protein HC905_17945 [Bacteroidales bacterium]|nr:hypothetical protein [Bacteroidales bacterium]
MNIGIKGVPSQEDIHQINSIINQLQKTIPFEIKINDKDPNLTLHFIKKDQVFNDGTTTFSPLVKPDTMIYNYIDCYDYKILVLINSDGISQLERNHLLLKNFTKAILSPYHFHDSKRYEKSIFNPASKIDYYSDADRFILAQYFMFYHINTPQNINNRSLLVWDRYRYENMMKIIIIMCLLVPVLFFTGKRTVFYFSVFHINLKSNWLIFNFRVLFFIIPIIIVILLVTGHFQLNLPLSLYLSLMLIAMIPANLVYITENLLLKKKKMFWVQYLSMFF